MNSPPNSHSNTTVLAISAAGQPAGRSGITTGRDASTRPASPIAAQTNTRLPISRRAARA